MTSARPNVAGERGSVGAYILWRVIIFVLLFFIASALTYFVPAAFGNPIQLIRLHLGNITPAQLRLIEQAYGAQGSYFTWLGNVLSGNLGISLPVGTPVSTILAERLPRTFEVVFPAVAVGLLVGTPLGVYLAGRRRYIVAVSAVVGALLSSTPAFVLGLAGLYVFSLSLGLLPAYGAASPFPPYFFGNQTLDSFAHFIMPWTSLTLVVVVLVARIARSNAVKLSEMSSQTQGSGVLRATAWLTLPSTGRILAFAMGAGLAVETVFTWPGALSGLLQAPLFADLMTAQGTLFVVLIVIIMIDLIFRVVPAAVKGRDPRLGSLLTQDRNYPEVAPLVGRWNGIREAVSGRMAKLGLVAVVVSLLLAAYGAVAAPYPQRSLACLQGCTNLPPFANAAHPLGTERSGIDVWSEILHGMGNDLNMALGAVVVAVLVGGALGMVVMTRRLGKRLDRALVVLWDPLALFPVLLFLPFVPSLSLPLTGSTPYFSTLIIVGLFGVPLVAAAVSSTGTSQAQTERKVDVLVPAVGAGSILVGVNITLLVTLEFLGFWSTRVSTLGLLMQEGLQFIRSGWWVFLFPALAAILVAVGFALLGYVIVKGPPKSKVETEQANNTVT